MKRHMGLFAIAAMLLLVLLAYVVFFQVDQLTDVVLVKTFGRVERVLWGHSDAGLQVKWPWPVQRIVRYDSRTRTFEDTGQQAQTRDDQNVIVSLYCSWRIDDPIKFHTAVETVEEAETRLRERLGNYKGVVIGEHDMSHLVSTDPREMRLKQIEREILEPLRSEAMRDYGVRVVDVGVKANALPESVSQGVILVQKTEREVFAEKYQSEGMAIAKAIESRAEAASEEILAFARRKASDIESQGYAEAAQLYQDFQVAPELAMFLRQIESLKRQLAENTVFILDGSLVPAIGYFGNPPEAGLKQSLSGKSSLTRQGQDANSPSAE